MLFLDESNHPSQKRILALEHNGEVIHFTVDQFRGLTANLYTVGDANTILSRLPQNKQDRLWDIYKFCYNKIMDVSSDELLANYLRDALAKIQDIVSYEDVRRYVKEKDSFWAPPDPKAKLPNMDIGSLNDLSVQQEGQNANINATSLTYTEEDFAELNALIIYMKYYLPVISQYFNRIVTQHENPIFVYYQALEVIDDTDIVTSLGYDRLHRYIKDYWAGKDTGGLSMSMLKNWVSEEATVDLTLSEILFKKVLPIGVSHRHHYFDDDKERPSLIRSLFHNVQSSVEAMTTKRGTEHYMNKDTSGRDIGSGEDPSSKNEQYRNVAAHTEQAIALANYFCHDLRRVVQHMDPSVPFEDAEAVIYEPLYHYSQHPFRLLMMKWLMNRFVSPSLILNLDQQAYGNIFKATIACLRHWGFDELAKTVDGNIDYDAPRENIYDLLPISIEQMKELDVYYPYTVQTTRTKGDSRRDMNYAARAITNAELAIRGYRLRGINYQGDHGSSTWICVTNIKHLLASLFIYLNQHGLLKVNA